MRYLMKVASVVLACIMILTMFISCERTEPFGTYALKQDEQLISYTFKNGELIQRRTVRGKSKEYLGTYVIVDGKITLSIGEEWEKTYDFAIGEENGQKYITLNKMRYNKEGSTRGKTTVEKLSGAFKSEDFPHKVFTFTDETFAVADYIGDLILPREDGGTYQIEDGNITFQYSDGKNVTYELTTGTENGVDTIFISNFKYFRIEE